MNSIDRKGIRIAALLLAGLCLLAGCKDKGGEGEGEGDAAPEDSGLPASYAMGEESIAALTPGEGAQMTQSGTVSYHYDGLTDSGGTVSGYVSQMTGEENGFSVVDSDFVEAEAPGFSSPEGEVLLAKSAAEPGKLVVLTVGWAEGSCTVTVTEAEGEISAPPEEMTINEAVDYLTSLPPASLGLEKASMEEYMVYPMSGVVLVDGQPCLPVKVYSNDNPEQSNELEGSYFLTSDGRHIYRLDEETDQVVELNP